MLKKEEKKEMNERFWKAFKKSMRKAKSTSSKKVNWVNYPTEIKNIYLRLKCEKTVSVNFDIQHKDDDIRDLIWDQLIELKAVLENSMKHPTKWTKNQYTKEGLCICSISWENDMLSLYKEEDWKEIHHFFKTRLVEFDEFYQEYKDILIHLVN